MANPTTNYGFVLPTSSDLVTDLPADFDIALQGVDTRLKALNPATTLGDLEYGSATANTNTRLGIGTTGQVLTVAGGVPSWATASSGSSNTAGKNGVLNSNFSIWQRGTSFTATSGYTADRWYVNHAVAGRTVSRQVTNDTTNLPFIQYALRYQRDSGNTNTANNSVLYQSFESVNSIPFAGKTVTMSFYARAGANYSAASGRLGVYLISGTGTDQNYGVGYTGAAFPINNQTATLTTTWQRFTFSGTVATTATELTTYFESTPTGTAGANDYFEVTGVQLEIASSASAYSPNAATLQGELAACQRYYFRYAASQYVGVGHLQSSGFADFLIKNPVTMRSTPTYAAASGTSFFQVGSAAATTSYSTINNFYSSGTDQVLGRINVSGFTAGQGCAVVMGSASAWVEGSAEL